MATTTTITESGQFVFAESTGQALGSFTFPTLINNVSNLSYPLQLTIGTSPASVTLPISPVSFLFIYNGSNSGTLSVTWTPSGGSSASIITLQPLSHITVSNGAITALSLTAQLASTPATVILGG